MNTTYLFQIQSFLIVALFFIGVYLRKNRNLHVKIMSSAIIWDIILILQIELSRGAIDKASKALTNPMILNIHISLAISAVVLYGFMIYFGRKLLQGNNSVKILHGRLGRLTLIIRVLTLITSFYAKS
jgi:hydrogenase-4 membrane subunit HyfE